MQVNGETILLKTLKDKTIEGLLTFLKLDSEYIAIEHNGKIIQKKDILSVTLQENDKLEIIHFVGGG